MKREGSSWLRTVLFGSFVFWLWGGVDWLYEHEGPENYSQGKAMIEKVYAPRPITFYCRCPYTKKSPDLAACGYPIRNDWSRAHRIEWEHVVPASKLGEDLPCYQASDSERGGLSPRKYCGKVDEDFNRREGDPMNLVPTVDEINVNRSNYPFAEISDFPMEMIDRTKGPYGKCPMRIFRLDYDQGVKQWMAEPPTYVRGKIARIYQAMAEKYDLTLSEREQRKFATWSANHPPDKWEIERERRISAFIDAEDQ